MHIAKPTSSPKDPQVGADRSYNSLTMYSYCRPPCTYMAQDQVNRPADGFLVPVHPFRRAAVGTGEFAWRCLPFSRYRWQSVGHGIINQHLSHGQIIPHSSIMAIHSGTSSNTPPYRICETPLGTRRLAKVILMGAGASSLDFFKQAEASGGVG
jgi:hypothetical protein